MTTKVSLSIRNDDLKVIKERAKRLHGGNVSAVFADVIAAIKRQEAWAKAETWYGDDATATESEQQEIDLELLGKKGRRKVPRKRRAE